MQKGHSSSNFRRRRPASLPKAPTKQGKTKQLKSRGAGTPTSAAPTTATAASVEVKNKVVQRHRRPPPARPAKEERKRFLTVQAITGDPRVAAAKEHLSALSRLLAQRWIDVLYVRSVSEASGNHVRLNLQGMPPFLLQQQLLLYPGDAEPLFDEFQLREDFRRCKWSQA